MGGANACWLDAASRSEGLPTCADGGGLNLNSTFNGLATRGPRAAARKLLPCGASRVVAASQTLPINCATVFIKVGGAQRPVAQSLSVERKKARS
jgi:hypothetical protein